MVRKAFQFIFLCLFSFQLKAQEQVFLKPKGLINDFEEVFTEKEETILDSLVQIINKRQDVVIVLVSLDSTFTTKELFSSYSLELANFWGIGNKEKHNGILIAFSKSLRVVRIHTGLGIEKELTDDETKSVIDHTFIPYFKKATYFDGIWNGILQIEKELAK